jgi:hypothetical protein
VTFLGRSPLHPHDRSHLAFIFTMSQSQSPEISADIRKQLLAGLDIFYPSRLVTEDDIAVAVNVLEGSLDKKSIGPIVICAFQPEYPYVFEFIVSCKLALFVPALSDR